jgi:hypothetical protein
VGTDGRRERVSALVPPITIVRRGKILICKTGVRDQRSEIRGQRSEIRDQRSEIKKARGLGFVASHPCAKKKAQGWGHGGFKVQVQQRIVQTSLEMTKRSHGKDGKQKTFSTFPRHCYGCLFEPVHKFCCTWTLNVPTQRSCQAVSTYSACLDGREKQPK